MDGLTECRLNHHLGNSSNNNRSGSSSHNSNGNNSVSLMSAAMIALGLCQSTVINVTDLLLSLPGDSGYHNSKRGQNKQGSWPQKGQVKKDARQNQQQQQKDPYAAVKKPRPLLDDSWKDELPRSKDGYRMQLTIHQNMPMDSVS
jgi:hypothetical protein